MKKYLLIAHNYANIKRGAHTTTGRLVNHFPDDLEYFEDSMCTNLNLLANRYKRIILVTQVPTRYPFLVNFINLNKINALIFLRNNFTPKLYNSCTNGFHCYNENSDFKHYIPTITNFIVENIKEQKIPCLGFYHRYGLAQDSFFKFLDILKNLKHKVNVCTMGNFIGEKKIKQFGTVLNYTHTHNNVEFFQNITHYIYPKSNIFVDPFPHSVLEAVQADKQIIIPNIRSRMFKDGVDDICDCINYHTDYHMTTHLDNTNNVLTVSNFRSFYEKLFKNNFEYSYDRSKYKRMIDWIENEIL